MKLCVLAVDYDGTIAHNDRPEASALDAIAAARGRGIKVLLVTGRISAELRRVTGDLRFVDAVVAENGAVVHFPETGYTTTLAPAVPPDLVAATEVILVTREANVREIDALRGRCAVCQHVDASGWDVLPALRLDQAAALPGTREAKGQLQVFTIGERLTPHVRHRQKYVDVPVSDSRAFVFGAQPGLIGRAHTLREFVAALESIHPPYADSYLRRGDFGKWVGDVFGDHVLAKELEGQERRYVLEKNEDVLDHVVAAIRSRYNLAEEGTNDTRRGTSVSAVQ